MSTVQAATILQPGEIALREYPMPEIEDDALLMRVAAVGVCGSDKHMYGGNLNVAWPVIPGHEFSGIIEKMGPLANSAMKIVGGSIQEGDAITVAPGSQACGRCWFCIHTPHRPQLCPNRTVFGFRTSAEAPHLFGAFSEYMYIPGNSFVLKLPEGLSLERATLCEPLAVAQRAAGRSLSPGIPYAGEGFGVGARCAVMGVGPIGLLVVAALKTMGAGEIIAVDMSEERLAFSEKVRSHEDGEPGGAHERGKKRADSLLDGRRGTRRGRSRRRASPLPSPRVWTSSAGAESWWKSGITATREGWRSGPTRCATRTWISAAHGPIPRCSSNRRWTCS